MLLVTEGVSQCIFLKLGFKYCSDLGTFSCAICEHYMSVNVCVVFCSFFNSLWGDVCGFPFVLLCLDSVSPCSLQVMFGGWKQC